MRSFLLTLLTATALAGLAETAQAGPLAKVWHSIKVDFKRNNQWPQPWIGPDRASVYAPMQLMVAKGWERQNLLHEEHFEFNSDELNEAGRMKVDQIIAITPPEFRAVYVPRAATPELTAERIAHVQNFVATRAQDEQPVEVLESRMRRNDFPADYVDQIGRAFRDSTPEPRIPPSAESTGGSSQTGGN